MPENELGLRKPKTIEQLRVLTTQEAVFLEQIEKARGTRKEGEPWPKDAVVALVSFGYLHYESCIELVEESNGNNVDGNARYDKIKSFSPIRTESCSSKGKVLLDEVASQHREMVKKRLSEILLRQKSWMSLPLFMQGVIAGIITPLIVFLLITILNLIFGTNVLWEFLGWSPT